MVTGGVFVARQSIVDCGRRLYRRGLIAGTEGNISVALSPERNSILTTPSGLGKGSLDTSQILNVSIDGSFSFLQPRIQNLKPSSEVKMHLEVYRRRSDVWACVHAHPPAATAFAVSGIPLTPCVLPEIVMTFGGAQIAPFGLPSTDQVPDSLAGIIESADVILLKNHGALSVGSTLEDAYLKMEALEHFATILLHCITIGKIDFLSAEIVNKLKELRISLGIKGPGGDCESCQRHELGKFCQTKDQE